MKIAGFAECDFGPEVFDFIAEAYIEDLLHVTSSRFDGDALVCEVTVGQSRIPFVDHLKRRLATRQIEPKSTESTLPSFPESEVKSVTRLKTKRSYEIELNRECRVAEITYDCERAVFWVQTTEENADDYSDELFDLADALSPPLSTNDFNKGDPLVAWFDESEAWYRAIVDDMSERGVRIIYVDFGNCETIEYAQVPMKLRVPNERILERKTFAWPLCLSGLDPNDISHIDRMTQNDAVNGIDDMLNSLTDQGAEWIFRLGGSEEKVAASWRAGVAEIDGELWYELGGDRRNFVQFLAEKNRECRNLASKASKELEDGSKKDIETAQRSSNSRSSSFLVDTRHIGSGRKAAIPFELDQTRENRTLIWLQLAEKVDPVVDFMAQIQDSASQCTRLAAQEHAAHRMFLGMWLQMTFISFVTCKIQHSMKTSGIAPFGRKMSTTRLVHVFNLSIMGRSPPLTLIISGTFQTN